MGEGATLEKIGVDERLDIVVAGEYPCVGDEYCMGMDIVDAEGE
jgi:hypothetical protein